MWDSEDSWGMKEYLGPLVMPSLALQSCSRTLSTSEILCDKVPSLCNRASSVWRTSIVRAAVATPPSSNVLLVVVRDLTCDPRESSAKYSSEAHITSCLALLPLFETICLQCRFFFERLVVERLLERYNVLES